MKGIVLHDFFAVREGGGRVALTLAQRLNFDLAFGFWGPNSFDKQELLAVPKYYDLGWRSSIHGWSILKHIYGYRYKMKFLENYDVIIYSGNYSPLAVYHHPQGKNIFYCHTPAAFLYEKKDFFFKRLPLYQKPIFSLLTNCYRSWYQSAVRKMSVIVSNSQNVQLRVRKDLELDSQVVYPPCDIEAFTWQGQGDYYLSFARLDPLKRVDLIVKAFQQMPQKKLIVCSGGADLLKIQQLSRGFTNIQVLGPVSHEQLRELIGNCIATLYIPIDEDFGISPVESMAAGKPVIGVAEGGLVETIIDGVTGILLKPNPDIVSLQKAIVTLAPHQAAKMRHACEIQAQKFSREQFITNMQKIILS